MKTHLLRRLPTVLVLLSGLTAPLCALESNESNLTLLDTQNPAIRDLAVAAGDLSTYESLNERNKIGVFFSEGLRQYDLGAGNKVYGFELLKNPEAGQSWNLNDFKNTTDGPLFFMQNGHYQRLPEMPWSEPNTSLYWFAHTGGSTTTTFLNQLLEVPTSWDAPGPRIFSR